MTNKRTKIWVIVSFLPLLLLMGGTLVLQEGIVIDPVVMNSNVTLAYTPHDPIHINGNADFLNQDFIEEWPGDGSPESPIIISGYSFAAAEHMLRVNNSDLHFRFENNELDGLLYMWCGIAIVNSANGVVRDNFVRRAAAGIHVVTVENITIQGNDVQDSTYAGIVVEEGSVNVTVTGNTVYVNNDYGILVGNPYGSEVSNDITIQDNIVHDNIPSGVCLKEADNCVVENNTIHGNSLDGILVESGSHIVKDNTVSDSVRGIMLTGGTSTVISNDVTDVEYAVYVGSENNNISNNYLANNGKTGIRCYYQTTEGVGGSNNIITGNTIANNSRWGLEFLAETSNNLVQGNDFLMNGYAHQACDDGVSNTFDENYWDDWTIPDDNLDEFVDNPYTINGTADNSDVNPLAAHCNPLPSWYTVTPSITPTGTTPLQIDPLLIAVGAGLIVIVLLVVVVVKKR